MLNEVNSAISAINMDIVTTGISSFFLILAAEMGDKSQLVCMTLAARYRAQPVFIGAVLAFIVLNSLAVIFGATLAVIIPDVWLSAVVCLLFLFFAFHTFAQRQANDTETIQLSYKHLLGATFITITLAELGDKTQLAVVALSSNSPPLPVWLGSTFALITSVALGIWLGRKALSRLPMKLVHNVSGGLFLLMAGVVLGQMLYRL